MDHPFGKRLADPAALKKARHHPAGQPVSALARDGTDKRIAVRRKSESAVDPLSLRPLFEGTGNA